MTRLEILFKLVLDFFESKHVMIMKDFDILMTESQDLYDKDHPLEEIVQEEIF